MARWSNIAVVSVAALMSGPPPYAVDDPAEAALKAHYIGKSVTATTDLPRTDGGFVIINDGALDAVAMSEALQGSSMLGVSRGGIGVAKGTAVVIQDLHVKSNNIQFFLGTSSGAEWKKALTRSSSPGGSPFAGTRAEPNAGAVIVIVNGAKTSKTLGVKVGTARPLTAEDMKIEALNERLSLVLDVRELASMEGLPDEQRLAIADHRVIPGMNKKAVFLARGEPKQKQTELRDGAVVETWIYEDASLKTTVVTLTNGAVTEMKEF